MKYSPKNSDQKLTDSNVWKHAVVSDGKAIKNLSSDEFKMLATDQLKVMLTA